MLHELRQDLQRLGRTTVEIYAQGEYPTKSRTPVQHVAKYQNDGTETIKPARFVERATGRHRGWQAPIFRAAGSFLFNNGDFNQVLTDAGLRISFDINRTVNRIKTGRLKRSFRPRIIEGSSASISFPTRGPSLRR
jgi:hypothetical protein